MRVAKIEIYPGANGGCFWRFRAANGLITADGAEGYADAASAARGARATQKAIATADIVDITERKA